jgi:phage I-like protein
MATDAGRGGRMDKATLALALEPKERVSAGEAHLPLRESEPAAFALSLVLEERGPAGESAGETQSPPHLIQVIPWGRHETERGAFLLDRDAADAVVRDFGERANDMVVDYEHQSLTGAEAPAAGWIKELFVVLPADSRGDETPRRSAGVWARVRWTGRARKYLKEKEYRYLSPVILKDAQSGRVLRLLGAALTNQPAIDGMVPLVNRRSSSPEKAAETCIPRKEDEMAEDESPQRAEQAAAPGEVLLALGLAEGVSWDEVTGAIAALLRRSERAGALEQEVRALREELSERKARELVQAAMKAGKITPAQRDWAAGYAGRDPEGFGAFVAKAPVLLPLGEGYPERAEAAQEGPGALQAAVNRALGIGEALWRKHNKRG